MGWFTHVVTKRTLNWRGRLLVLAILIGIASAIALRIRPFLEIVDPIDAKIMVVEGWMSDKRLRRSIRLFERDGYELMLVTGGPLYSGAPLVDAPTHATRASRILEKMGMDATRMVAVPGADVATDRTYASAKLVREWLKKNQREGEPLNLVTASAHARRSWMLYQLALGDQNRIGVIAIRSVYAHGKRDWWSTSYGVRTTLGETIAYLYALGFVAFTDPEADSNPNN